MTAYDRVLIYILVFAAILSFFAGSYWAKTFGESGNVLVVKQGERVKEYSLAQSRTLELDGCVVKVEKGRVRVISSTCPRKICMSQGEISEVGQSITCLPHRLLLRVVGRSGGADSSPDSVVK